MIGVIVAFGTSLVISLLLTPRFVNFLIRREYGQFIRQDGPEGHFTKRGTPTMGGVVFIFAILAGWLLGFAAIGSLPSYSSVLLAGLLLGLGLIGFLDDFVKISRHRSLGLNPAAKIAGQLLVGSAFALAAILLPTQQTAPASLAISFARPSAMTLGFAGLGLGVFLFVLWANLLVSAWSNAVNLTDGLDGLATGASIAAFGGYTFISLWQVSQSCGRAVINQAGCYETQAPLGLGIFAAAVVGGLVGFLWWNASPAQIFMGDTGALAIGGAFAGLSILSNTEVLAVVIGGLFFVITMSDVIQILVFKRTGKRVFRMAPLHHHFELKGWDEVTIVIRFWIVAGLFALVGVGLFYAEWVGTL